MARRSIRDLIRRKSRGRKAMTSDMRELIDSFDAHKPAVRAADALDGAGETAPGAMSDNDAPADVAHSGPQR